MAVNHATITRQHMRHLTFLAEMANVNRMAGGEPRKIRRAMARDRAKRVRKLIKNA